MTVPIVVDGTHVGTAEITLPSGGDPAVTAARAALLRTVGQGAVLAVLLAAVFMSRPLVALTAATRSFAAGEPDAERLLRPAPRRARRGRTVLRRRGRRGAPPGSGAT